MRRAIRQLISEQLQRTTAWLSTGEALEKLRVGGMRITAPTLIAMIHREEVIGKRVGKKFFITTESIENLLRVKSS
jgi:hypothetical protein